MKRTFSASTTLRVPFIGYVYTAIVAILACCFSAATQAQQGRVTHAQAVERAKQIVAKMTLDEKITELHGVHDAARYAWSRVCHGWEFPIFI
jgi:hypothetical protein